MNEITMKHNKEEWVNEMNAQMINNNEGAYWNRNFVVMNMDIDYLLKDKWIILYFKI